ncbi:MAG: VCBS repeat-containing protein [Acidobacteria bacterium]|nr:VCBS repeat-containing protein [Acidobacteriota bacterium]
MSIDGYYLYGVFQMNRLKLLSCFAFATFAALFFGNQILTLTASGQGSLSAPTAVLASDNNYADKVGVYWDTIRGATLYRIFRNTTNNSATATDVGTTAANFFFDLTPTAGQPYFYWVKAENGAIVSPFSNSDQGTRAVGGFSGGLFPPLDPPAIPAENPVTAAKAYLGKALFWDEQLSSTRTVSCGTCHRAGAGGSDPRTIFGDSRSRNPGFDNTFNTADDPFGSPGVPQNNADGSYVLNNFFKFNEQVTGRKSPSYLNAGYSPNGIFWDGRATSQFRDPLTNAVVIPSGGALESQVLGPPLSSAEMAHGGRNWTQVAARVAVSKPLALATNIPTALQTWINGRNYPQLFEEAFGTADVTPVRIALAIGTHERILFSDQTPLDKDSANIETLTSEEELGKSLFVNLQCAICHSDALMSDQQFHNIGVRPPAEDLGRGAITGLPDDNGRFRTPTLRNIELRGPFMHNGRFATLEDVVEFYNRGGDFDAPNIDHNLIRPLNLTPGQKAALVSFLKRPLTDLRVKNELPPFDRPTLYTETNRVPVVSGTGRAGSGAITPKVTAIEPPLVGNPSFTVGVSDSLGGAQAVLVIDSADPGVGSSIPAAGSFARQTISLQGSGNGNGWGSISLAIPNQQSLVGQTFYGRWYVTDAGAVNGFSVSQVFSFTVFGTAAVTPATFADFDGDGKTDISIFRPSNGQWWLARTTLGVITHTFGNSSDKLAPADFTGDGKTDVAIYRPSSGSWFVLRSENFSFYSFPFGASGDIPAPGDFDADGKADAAVFRPSNATWYVQRSSDNGTTIQQFGANGDVPQVGDYDGDGRADMAIYRPSVGQWWLNRSTAGVIAATFGISSDKPMARDFTGDGKTDLAFWRPSSGEWFVLRSEDSTYYSAPFGISTDIPVAGDYDGDGKADTAVFRPSAATWYVNRSTQGLLIQSFGAATDIPVPSAY